MVKKLYQQFKETLKQNKNILVEENDNSDSRRDVSSETSAIEEKLNTILNKSLIPSSTKLQYPIEEKFKDNKYNNKINNKYNGNNNFCKKNMANFEQRDYTNYDFTKLYANADRLV